MATEVASLVARIGADVSGLERGLRQADREVSGFAKKTGKSLQEVGGDMRALGAATVPITGALVLSAKAAIDWEYAFAGVVKTVDATDDQLKALERQMRTMATMDSPVSALQDAHITLAGIGEAAGQLGVGIESIQRFAEVSAMAGVATNMTSTEFATFAARFANVAGLDVGENIERIGDTIVTLGNNLATTESELANFGQRLSPLASFNWEPERILAYGGALSSLGVSAELGGTNLIKTVGEITKAVATGGDKLQGFADIAGMTATEFAELNRNNPEASFNAFIRGLAGMDASQQILALNNLNITGIEQISVLQRLASGYGVLEGALELAGEAWAGNGALQNEAATRAATLQGQLNRLSNNVQELQINIGNQLTPTIADMVGHVTTAVQEVNRWIEGNPELASTLTRVAAGVAVFGTALLAAGAFIGVATPAVAALGAGLALLASPLGLAVVGLAALATVAPMVADALSEVDFAAAGERLVEALDGISISTGDLTGMADAVKNAVTDAVNGVTLSPSDFTLPGEINSVIGNSFTGTIDLSGVNVWAEQNMNRILETVISVAGIVLGGPVGLAIGGARLIAMAIESDFMGIGTFLDQSGISASVEGALSSLRTTIDGIISSVFGGGGAAPVPSPANFDFTGMAAGGGVGVLGKFGDDLRTGLGAITSVIEGVKPDITTGLDALGAGVQRFISGITGAETEGLYDAIRPVLAVIGGLVTGATALAGFGVGTVLEAVGNAIGPFGEALGGLITAASRLGEGDLGGALEALGGGIRRFAEGVLAVPLTVVDNVIEKINEVTGLNIPNAGEGLAAIGAAFGAAWRGLVIIIDNIRRGLDSFFEGLIFRILDSIGTLQDQVMAATGFDLGIRVNDVRFELQDKIAAREAADALTSAIQEQMASGQGIDLGQAFDFSASTGVNFGLDLAAQFNNPNIIAQIGEAGKLTLEQAYQFALDNADLASAGQIALALSKVGLEVDTTGLVEQVSEQVRAALETNDQGAYFAALQLATELGLNAVEIQQQVSAQVKAAAEATHPTATVSATVRVNPIVQMMQDVGALVAAAAGGLAAKVAPPGSGSEIKGLSVGTPMVYQEGLAYLHAGERVLTADENRALARGGRPSGTTVNLTVNASGTPYQMAEQIRRALKDGTL